MKLTIGVMGSSGGDLDDVVRATAYRLGEAIAGRDAVLITGGCPGLPYEAVRGAKAKGGMVVGISPGLHRGASGQVPLARRGLRRPGLHGERPHGARDHEHPVVRHRGDRRGRTGTLGELAIAYDEGRLIGVLTGTGGITDVVETIIRVSGKTTGACILYDDDPTGLVDRLIAYFRTEHFRKPSCFCDASAEG